MNNLEILLIFDFYLRMTLKKFGFFFFLNWNNLEIEFISYFHLSITLNYLDFVFILDYYLSRNVKKLWIYIYFKF